MAGSVSSHLNEQLIPLQNVKMKDNKVHDDIYYARSPAGELDSNLPEMGILSSRQSIDSNGSLREDDQKGPKGSERPKVLMRQNRAKAFYYFLLFHAIPLAAALYLIILNLKTRYYGVDASWIAALQFAAKAHEVLMQASIVTVMIAYLQYLLTNKSAVPFGAIFSAYHVAQMSYLWSPEFRASLTASGFPPMMKIGFALFVPFSISLATAVGPSSAIAMQPRMVNYTVPEYRVALNVTNDDLYPDSFNKAGPSLIDSNPYDLQVSPAARWEYLEGLPSVGKDEATKTGLDYIYADVGDGESKQIPVMPRLYSVQLLTSAPWYLATTPTRILYVQYAPNSTFVTVQNVQVALALSDAAQMFGARLPWGASGTAVASIETPQPYASVLCEMNTIMDGNDTRPIQFPDSYVAGCGDEDQCALQQHSLNTAGVINYTAITRQQLWDQAHTSPKGRMIWVDDIHISGPVAGTSLGVIVVQPDLCEAGKTFLTTSACVVGARWANTKSSMQLSFGSDSAASNSAVVDSVVSPASLSTEPQWSQASVALSKQWAESLNPLTTTQNRTVADNLLRTLPITDNICPPNGSYSTESLITGPSRPFMHEALIASLVANGMSNAGGITEQWRWKLGSKGKYVWADDDKNGNNERSDPPGTVLTFQGFLPGYAWNLDGTSIKIAIPVLIIYCLYTVVYVLYTFFTGRGSMAWSAISGLTALAINSTPSKALENTSAGIDRTDTYKKLVSVREVEANERLELVFQQDEESRGLIRRVAAGRAY